MAEFAVFSLASKVLSTIASPALQMAYEKGCSVWDARDDLDKLRATVETIHAVLLDAEKKQEGSETVKDWIKRVKGVLYDADDLFDEIPTDDMFMQQLQIKKGNKHLKKGCKKRDIKLCGSITAARQCNRVPEGQWEKLYRDSN